MTGIFQPRFLAPLAALLVLAACGPGAPVTAPSPSAAQGSADPAMQAVALINAERKKAGLAPLAPDPELAAGAAAHSRAMAEADCVGPVCGGEDIYLRVARAGYRVGTLEGTTLVGMPGPKLVASILAKKKEGLVFRTDFRHIGVGYHFQADDPGALNYRHYWTLVLGTPANENLDEIAREVTRLVNLERAAHGLEPLLLNPLLNKSAQFHAEFMADNDCYGHDCPNEPDMLARIRNAGYDNRLAAENIAGGARSPAEAVAGWMRSPAHRENILHPAMREIGVGYVLLNEDGGEATMRHYWVQNFGVR